MCTLMSHTQLSQIPKLTQQNFKISKYQIRKFISNFLHQHLNFQYSLIKESFYNPQQLKLMLLDRYFPLLNFIESSLPFIKLFFSTAKSICIYWIDKDVSKCDSILLILYWLEQQSPCNIFPILYVSFVQKNS